jgi:hypothetical protein
MKQTAGIDVGFGFRHGRLLPEPRWNWLHQWPEVMEKISSGAKDPFLMRPSRQPGMKP